MKAIMKMYYCERFDVTNPKFQNYKGRFRSDEEAIKFFKEKHGEQLECIYDEDFKMVWEGKAG